MVLSGYALDLENIINGKWQEGVRRLIERRSYCLEFRQAWGLADVNDVL